MENQGKIKTYLLGIVVAIGILFNPIELLGQRFIKINSSALLSRTNPGYGAAIYDYNNDGLPDIYVNNSQGKSIVFKNLGNDEFVLAGTVSIISSIESTSGISFADFDNDGLEDLYVTSMGGTNSLMQHISDTVYTRLSGDGIPIGSGFQVHCTWGDINNDGLVDLFVPVVGNTSFGRGGGVPNHLYINLGDGKFAEQPAAEPAAAAGNNVSANFCDIDNDGDLDLFMTECLQDNYMFENVNGVFTRIDAGVTANALTSIACSWGDYDNDGFMDLFVANGSVTAGQKVNSYLYHNNGDKTFTKITSGELAEYTGNGWNGLWADFDNDGDLDLFYGSFGEPDMYFENTGDGSFTKHSEFDNTSIGTSGASFGDYNNDGYLDLFTANAYGTGNLLYKNSAGSNNWLFVKCTGNLSNKSAVGARVKIKATISGKSYWQVRQINSNIGFRAAAGLAVHFGLGDAQKVDSLIVIWPAGGTSVLTDINVNQRLQISEAIPEKYLNPMFKSDIHSGYSPLKVCFTDKSVFDPNFPVTSWSWDFDGDGEADSHEQNPVHIFNCNEVKEYNVTLTVSNGSASSSVTKTALISVKPSWTENIALGANARSSSVNRSYFAVNAVDGKPTTSWFSLPADSQWLQVKLDTLTIIGKVIIKWTGNYAKQYKISVTEDSTNWTDIFTADSSDGKTDELLFTPVKALQVRVFCTNSATAKGFAIFELEVYKPVVTSVNEAIDIPDGFTLKQNYPNPFNPNTNIEYSVPVECNVNITVFNILGEKIECLVNKKFTPGTYRVNFNAGALNSGVYICRMQAGGYSSSNKMLLLK